MTRPGSPFDRVTDIIGVKLAARLSQQLGGKRVYVPKTVSEHHPLASCIGLVAGRKVAQEFGGEFLDIPLSARKRLSIVQLHEAGLKPEAIRKRVDCTRRYVFQVLADLKEPPATDQLPLF